MAANIFISHSSKDQKIARTICSALESRGLKCWIASRDVGPGENFMEAIVRAIRSAKVMVLVFSSNANGSDEIKKELVLASQNKLIVIPVRVEDVLPNDALAYEFATRNWIDLFSDWESQIERLSSWIAGIVAVEPKPHVHGDSTPVESTASPQEKSLSRARTTSYLRRHAAAIFVSLTAIAVVGALAVFGLLRSTDSRTKESASSQPATTAPQPAGTAPGSEEARIVNVYNWSDYLDPKVLQDFTRETGIRVAYDTFDSNEMLEKKLLNGQSGYDLVVPSAYFLGRAIPEGLFQKLDKARLANLGNVWFEVAYRLADYDPGNQYAVNYAWGTTGIGYNVTKMREILGPEGRIDSWDVIFKPEQIARFKDCGIYMLGSADDMFPIALHYLFLNPSSREPAELEKAADLLMKIRPYIRKFHSSEYLGALASGEICLVVGYSGDIKQAQKRATETNKGVEIGYVIPKEGAPMWFDNLAIPANAKHTDAAHTLIDYLLRPDIAARNSNFMGYANGNFPSQKLIAKSILDDPTIFPDEATKKRLYTSYGQDPTTIRLMSWLWNKVKASK